MRAIHRLAITASTIAGLVAPLTLAVPGPWTGAAFAQGDQQAEGQPKQIALTQTQIDGVLAAQKEMAAIEAKLPQAEADKPDPKVEAELDAIAKKNGFSGLGEYAAASSSIGIVMAGMDPETKQYVGAEVMLKKQIAEVKADKTMPPKEKKEALAELNGEMSAGGAAQPLAGNVALVGKNFDRLSQSMQQGGGGGAD